MQLGMVTYLWGAKWDLPTLIKNCEQTGFAGVELRSTHAHGVEPTLNDKQREDVRKRFEDSPVTCVGLGSACEYHSTDPAVVKKNIELTKQFVILAHDVGATGVKVRPNGLNKDEDPRETVERIGKALHKCGEFAEGYGQEIRVEVHGRGTQDPKIMRQIFDVADHPSVRLCWNSNPGEVKDGSIAEPFKLLKDTLANVIHIHRLYDPYPYRELFGLLKQIDYGGWCLSESPATEDPIEVMHYYRVLFNEWTK
jgi:sugar phosphate isomerase/epimerase